MWTGLVVFSKFCQTWSWADFWGKIVDWIELFNSSQVAFGFLSMILFLLFPGSSLLRGAFPQETNSGKVSFFLSFQLYFPTWWHFLSQSFIRKVFYAQDKTRWCHFFISRCVYGNHWQRQTWQALRKTNKAFSCFSMSTANTPLCTLRNPIHFLHFKTFSPLDWISFGVWMLFNDRDIYITNSAGNCELFFISQSSYNWEGCLEAQSCSSTWSTSSSRSDVMYPDSVPRVRCRASENTNGTFWTLLSRSSWHSGGDSFQSSDNSFYLRIGCTKILRKWGYRCLLTLWDPTYSGPFKTQGSGQICPNPFLTFRGSDLTLAPFVYIKIWK